MITTTVLFSFFPRANVWAITCTHIIKSFNVSPNPANLTGKLSLAVVVNRSDTVCAIGGTTDYTAFFYYTPASPAGSATTLVGTQQASTYFNGDTKIALDIVPKEKRIAAGSYIFSANVRVVQDSLTLESAGVQVEISGVPEPKFSCKNNDQCVEDRAGRYLTRADCQKECGKPGGGGGEDGDGKDSGGGRETATKSIEFKNPIANDDLISLVKSIGAWIYKLAIPVAVVAIIYGGGLLLLSQGNTKMIDRGRKTLLYAVIGLVIIFIGRGFFTLIKSILELAR